MLMPSTTAHLLAEGVRAERTGALDRALELYRAAAADSQDAEVRAEALTREADVLRARCEWDSALDCSRQAQTIAREARLFDRLTEAAIAEANIWMCRGDFAEAMPRFGDIVSTSTLPRLRGIALQNIGSMHAQTGQPRAAGKAFEESMESFREAGYARGEAIALNNLGRLALDSRDPGTAMPYLERSLALAREIEDYELAALACMNLSLALCEEKQLERSQDLAMAALGYFAEEKNRWREIECLRLVGQINECREDFANAKRCYELALNLAEQIGSEPEAKETRDRLSALSKVQPRPYL
jgi:tetratricopeptide (TPR) repeat protein